MTDNGPAAAVLPYDLDRRKAVLIRQFRAAVLHSGGPQQLIETVAGLLDEDDPETCARREALEEAGLRLGSLESLGVGWSAPGATAERVFLFLAPYQPQDRIAAGGGVAQEQEDIEVLEFDFQDLRIMMERHAFADLKTMVLVQALMLRHPELFRSSGTSGSEK